MENQYLLLVSVLLGMTVGAVVYGVAAKIVSIWSGEPEAAGDARRDSLLFLILRPIAKRIENSKGDAKELAECRRLLDAAGPFWGGMSAAEVLAVRYLMLPLGILWGAVIGGALREGEVVDNRLTGDITLVGNDLCISSGAYLPCGTVAAGAYDEQEDG